MPEPSTSISSADSIRAEMHPEAISGTSAAETAEKATGVSLRAVTKMYGPVVAVQDISIDIAAGTYCCLLGPSGCGKTTTLRMIAGHEEITYGDIFIGSRRVNTLPPVKRDTAMVFQSYALFPHKTVWDNVDFGLKMKGLDKSVRQERVGEILDVVGLSRFAQRKPDNLSGGQQQRVALARALVTRPQVLLLDEPLSALDETLRVKTRGELRRLQKQFGLTFIQVTHAQDEAFSLSDQIVVMGDGHVDQIGTPQRIFNRPASRFVANFMGDNNLFEGKVTHVAATEQEAIAQLEVPRLGNFTCRAEVVPDVGSEAAFCVRADAMQVTPLGDSPAQSTNHLSARIVAIEFTGYITRVSMLIEATGQELLYKARTQDWLTRDLQESQVVEVHWMTEAANFLSH